MKVTSSRHCGIERCHFRMWDFVSRPAVKSSTRKIQSPGSIIGKDDP
jgi:hypothetical protein